MRARPAVVVAVVCLALAGCADDEPSAVRELSTIEPRPGTESSPTPHDTTPSPSAAPAEPTHTAEPTPSAEPVETTAAPEPTAEPTTAEPEQTAAPPDEPTEPADPEPDEPEPDEEVDEPEPSLAGEVVELTNDVRADHGCPALRPDDRLTEAAQLHSEDMVERDYFDHTSPDGAGPGDRAEQAGYERWSGENIAMGYATAADVVDGWMNSEGHRANILNCDSQAIGVGVADGDGGLRWTQMFGTE
ncbi:CAP domain-containing protein [Jiangella gansuensis]|uniref:CAP domain-containing protein n=1 Tax=Jiangella gansuensis TaxID=281473 RepID=UPI0004B5807E|nr:CAP domain-containing protein [Jiangella gansuensis]